MLLMNKPEVNEEITLCKDEYAFLLSAAEKFQILKDTIYANAKTNLFQTGLAIADMDKVMAVLEAIDRQKYKEVLDGLNQI